ncbi:hypothetical protein SLA2020_025280 [Shorea laevis]
MPGLDPEIAVHAIPLMPECPPVKQKLRRMKPETLLKIKEEVNKLLDVGFIEVAMYPQWVANIVPVPKKDGKVRMCVDYRDLNKASPKDDFPLPHIQLLVDNAGKSAKFSFVDGYSGYNQIKIKEEDKIKTTFITLWGTFCYKVMPFGLKNAGATYQRAMIALLHDLIHKIIEVYVDDMIIRSGENEDHLVNLKIMFKRLRKHQLRLNPAKCTFGVTSGKLLGFIVSRRGIEIDLAKIKAIEEMPPPKTQKEKNNPGVWDDQCQEAFDKIKQYLKNPPILVPPVDGRPLILYMTVLEGSMGVVLAQHDDSGRKEQAIYYVSKKFNDCESRYSSLEKTCCALAWIAKKLRHYMLSNTTWLISRMDPIKYIFEKPSLSGRIARWHMLLSEFEIIYMTQKAVKGQAIADHLAKNAVEDYQPVEWEFPDEDIMAIEESNCETSNWKMYFDGAANQNGSGVGAVLVSPKGEHFSFAVKLDFSCTKISLNMKLASWVYKQLLI